MDNTNISTSELQAQIRENSKRIDEHLVRLHQVRLEIEELRKKSDERVKKYL